MLHPPQLVLEFSQLYSARLLQPGEHEKVRVKPSDAKYVVQLAYIGEGGRDQGLTLSPEDSVSAFSMTLLYQVM